MPQEYTVENGERYKLSIRLSGWHRFATNNRVAREVSKHGFDDVTASGTRSRRTALGVWAKETATGPSPDPRITDIVKVS